MLALRTAFYAAASGAPMLTEAPTAALSTKRFCFAVLAISTATAALALTLVVSVRAKPSATTQLAESLFETMFAK